MNPSPACQLIVRFHKPVAILIAILTVVGGWLLISRGLKEDYRLEAFVASDDPSYAKFQSFVKEFTSNEFAVVAIHTPKPFDDSVDAMLVKLNDQFQTVENVQRCNSIASIPKPLRAMLGDRLFSHPLLEGNLISHDRRTVAILLQMSAEDSGGAARRRSVGQMRDIVSQFRERHRNVEIFLTGPYVTLIDMYAYVDQDLLVFSVLAFMLIVVTLWIVFRRIAPMLFAGFVGLSAIVLTLALTVVFGIVASLITQMLVILVVVLAVANCVHLAVAAEDAQKEGDDAATRSRVVLGHMLMPCAIIMLTTAAGFGSVSISSIAPVKRFGGLMVFGLVAAFVGSVATLPPLIRWGGVSKNPEHRWAKRVLSWFAELALAHRKKMLAGFFVLGVVMLLGGTRIQFQSDFIKNFRAGSEIRQNYNFIEEHLTPLGSTELVVRRRDGGEVVSASTVRTGADVATAFVSKLPMVRRALSLRDALSLVAPGSIETDEQAIQSGQLLRLIPGGAEILRNFLNDTGDTMRINFRCVEGFDVQEKLAACNQMKDDAQKAFGPEYEVEVTGLYHFYSTLVDGLLRDQYRSFALAGVCIAVVLAFAFRGVRMLVILLLVNSLPVLFCVGVMGWFGIPVNMTAAMMLSVTLGIAVDDTVHYVWRLKREHAKHGDLEKAIRDSHESVGRACLFTTIVIACGFSILLFSRFLPTAYFGGLLAVTMLAALASDLWLLPALILTLRPFRSHPIAPIDQEVD
ncbi:MAG: RND transporter [Phycisphaerae bacterium]|nr:MAG: RND transporter [Phycisphaerae bacterium]